MLETFGYIALGLAVAAVVILALAARQPGQFYTAHTARIAAPSERLFALINDLQKMNTWNPYALRETSGTGTYSGAASGKGAIFEFAGPKSGTGRISIVDAAAPSKVVMHLQMIKPFRADNMVEFTLKPDGPATSVTWAMSGRRPLLVKIVSLFIDCDKMAGRDFEIGLGNLKAIAERADEKV